MSPPHSHWLYENDDDDDDDDKADTVRTRAAHGLEEVRQAAALLRPPPLVVAPDLAPPLAPTPAVCALLRWT